MDRFRGDRLKFDDDLTFMRFTTRSRDKNAAREAQYLLLRARKAEEDARERARGGKLCRRLSRALL